MSGPHNKIIAAAAKSELQQLGFKRQGRSRLWIKDHGSWLNIVAFKPSQLSVTVQLDNAAHWLWGGAGFMSLNYIAPSSAFVEWKTEDQFATEVNELARSSALVAQEIDDKFSSFSAIAEFAVAQANKYEPLRPSWFGYYAGVALGITGELSGAATFLRGVTDERVAPHAERFVAVSDDAAAFKRQANEIVEQQRVALKLPSLEEAPF